MRSIGRNEMAETGTAPKPNVITCEQCRDLLSEYVDREIDEPIRASIERHLMECNRCVTESTRLQGLKNVIRHWDGVKGTGKFRDSVMQQMIRESQQTQIAPGQLEEATAAAKESKLNLGALEDADEPKPMPPVWLLIAAVVLSVVVYFVVLKMRGG